MITTNFKNPPHDRILNCYVTIAQLITLLESSNLAPEVKAHCKLGLSVISILYVNVYESEGVGPLLNKEYDAFYKVFPDFYFKCRGLIPMDLLILNMESCIQHDKLIHVTEEQAYAVLTQRY